MKKVSLIGLMAMVAATLQAQQTLNIQQCREMALQNNAEIKAAQSKTQGARYTQKSYKANYFPTLDLNIIGLYSTAEGGKEMKKDVNIEVPAGNLPVVSGGVGTEGVVAPAQETLAAGYNLVGLMTGTNTTPGMMSAYFPGINMSKTLGINLDYEVGPMLMAGVSLKQPIYMGGKIANASKMAGMGVEMAEQNEKLAEANVIEATDQAYALVVRAKEMKKVAERYNEVLKELMANVEKAKTHGMRTSNDVMKVKVKLNESELNMLKAENGIKLAKMNLCHTIGMDLNADIDVTEDYPHQEICQATDITSRPEYRMLDKKVQIAEAKTKIERSDMLPEVGAMLSYNYLNGFKINDEKLLEDGAFTAMLKVKIPLFNFGKSGNKVRAAKSSLEETRQEQKDLNEKMTLELQRAINNMSEAEKEMEVAERSLEQAAENMRASKSMYDNGVETLSDYMEAQVLWQQAMATKVNANYQLYLCKVDVCRTSGQLMK